MSLTPSNMLPLGTVAPDFTLLDTVTGEEKSLQQLKSPIATVVMFICNHCPYVVHIRDKLITLAADYQQQNISFIAISSNDVNDYPQDSPAHMAKLATELNFSFPYLYDESQAVAKAYQAACTPDFYIFDAALQCVYRGRFDGSSPGKNTAVTGEDLSNALDCTLNQQPITGEQIPSMGCNIKWRED